MMSSNSIRRLLCVIDFHSLIAVHGLFFFLAQIFLLAAAAFAFEIFALVARDFFGRMCDTCFGTSHLLVFDHGVAVGFASALGFGELFFLLFFVGFVSAVFFAVCDEVGFWLLGRELWWGGGIGVPDQKLADGAMAVREQY